MLPDNFCVMFEGLPGSKIHSVAVFATDVINREYFKTMLECAPLSKEGDLRKLEDKLLLEETLQDVKKNL